MIRRLNMPIPDLARLSELSEKRRPLGMFSTRPTYQLLRETYYDTTDGALDERDIVLRVRSEARGHAVLEMALTERVSLQGVLETRLLETPLVGGGLYATLAGESEIAVRVRELIDPHALRPRLALDIDREHRDLRRGLFGRPTHRLILDEIVAHVKGTSRNFQEVTITEVSSGKTTLEELGDRLCTDSGIVPDGVDTFRRVRRALVAEEGAPRPEIPHDVRVALLLMHEGCVALVEGGEGFMLPSARGSGEDLAREFLTELTPSPSARPDVDLVGYGTARRGGSDLEVWLHEMGGEERPDSLLWIPLVELMERLGGPRLRDPGLVATLLMLVRSETGRRLLREAPQRREPPRDLPMGPGRGDHEVGEAPDDFLDLELSILEFNQRVLELAEDVNLPLLERLRFLSIFSSNNDEFFVVRVGRLKDEVSRRAAGAGKALPAELLLDLIAVRVRALVARQYACLNQVLLPALAERGVRVVEWDDLDEGQRTALHGRFAAEIFPLLTPLSMASGPTRSFPMLVSLGLALAISLRRSESGRSELGYVHVPDDLRRYMPVPESNDLILVERVIAAQMSRLFPGTEIDAVYAFRASRQGDVEIDEDSSGSLLARVADGVEERRYKPIVRLEVAAAMPREIRATIVKAIRDEQTLDAATLTRSDVYEAPGPVDLRGLAELADADMPGETFPPFTPDDPIPRDRSIFDVLGERDVLCHHPFHDFSLTVGRFLNEAANDPDVVSIKLTLYRTGRHSPIMDALLLAMSEGKEVSVFVELTARFDEASNIEWTRRLEAAGARVVYGVMGYKTHAKTALVVRREGGGVRRYVHIGTGNYNAATARFYTDFGLMSSDPDLGADLNDFFNELTGGAGPPQLAFRRLLVAPHSLVQGIDRMIQREIEHARAGRVAVIQAKVNGLADREVVESLYEASRAGVRIDLIVRSICTLRPGVPGLSEGVQVRSILGRFLEHSRVFYFENAGQSEYYIGSADWRARNLRRRVEVVTPVDDPEARATIRSVLDAQLADPRAWALRPDGVFERLRGTGPTSQERFMAPQTDTILSAGTDEVSVRGERL